MKLSRRLIPAIAMLMVSAVLMSTASFAWFSMNREVTATGISVTAKAPDASLLISQSKDSGYASTIALKNENTEMSEKVSPVADKDKGNKFYKLNTAGQALVNESGVFVAPEGVTVGNSTYYTESTTDYYMETFYLKLDDGAEGASASIDVTASWVKEKESAETIRGAIHILLFVGDATTGQELEMETTETITGLLNLTSTATKITVYVFLDGEDLDCANQYITEDLAAQIDLTFTIGTGAQG